MTRQGSEAMPIAFTHDGLLRRDTSLRVLIVDASPSCRFTIATSESVSESIEKVEVTEATRAELERHTPDDWDIVITHVHEHHLEESAPAYPIIESRMVGGGLEELPDRSIASKLRAGTIRGWKRLFHRFFHRETLTPLEQEESQATQTMVLADMQRKIGVALSAIEMGDFDTIGEIACRLRDAATTYDFPRLSGLGAALVDTVPSRDIRTARNIAQKLMTYMGKTIGYYLS
jgi:hypothetical protein